MEAAEKPGRTKYTIGIDFGTLSGRAVLVSVSDGAILAAADCPYPHAVMDQMLPDGTALPRDWALQDPQDYLDVLYHIVPKLFEDSSVSREDVIAIGTDFTSSTVLPVDEDGVPLCKKSTFSHNPHAYVKLWKHHGAQRQAERITELLRVSDSSRLRNYGGKISCESAIPKLLELYEEAREVYDEMWAWVEAADWIVWQLTGRRTANSCCAGYKSLYTKGSGFPSHTFFESLAPGFGEAVLRKYDSCVLPEGQAAGYLTKDMAAKLGLRPGLPVAVGNIDAHACVPAAGITGSGQLLSIIGTSSCFMAMTEEKKFVPGISGIVEDGIIPGLFAYEAGQSCVGDLLQWFTENWVPDIYFRESQSAGVHIQQHLSRLAAALQPGESGLLALDWWNGNRSILSDPALSGVIMGLTLQTKPEEIYRALIEATAFGARVIVENYREHGVPVDSFYAVGGISRKNPLAMQIYADVLNMDVRVCSGFTGSASGSAIWAAVAAGDEGGGYRNISDAARAMSCKDIKVYSPVPEHGIIYEALYREYKLLHDSLSGSHSVLKRLSGRKQRS